MTTPEWAERQWFAMQSPMSEMMQPRARYVRNVVTETVAGHAPQYAGIVIESWYARAPHASVLMMTNACAHKALAIPP